MSFVPDDFTVPLIMRTDHLTLRMLTPAVIELDYEAFMESKARLRLWSGGGWPAEGFTLVDNRTDLEEHEREFRAREAFAYTVLNHDETRCEGCVYINPLTNVIQSRRMDVSNTEVHADEQTAAVSFWVRDGAQPLGLDRELLQALIPWFQRDWEFSSLFFLTNSQLVRDQEVYRAVGLEEPVLLPADGGRFDWQLWRLTGSH